MENSNIMKYYNSPDIWEQDPTQHQVEITELILSKIPNGVKSILDIGCGNGIVTNRLAKKYDRVCAVDISEEALKYVQTEKIVGSIDKLPFKDEEFDLILISDVLEHLPTEVFEKGIQELQRVTKRYILIVTPFQEKLEFGMMTCNSCLCQFHVNLHIHSINKETIVHGFGAKFIIKQMSFGGDEWSHIPLYAKQLKSLYHYSNNWDNAVCPQCGVKQNNPSGSNRKIITNPKFYDAIADSVHKVMDQLRLEEFLHNEALFLLEKDSGSSTESTNKTLLIESDVRLKSVKLISDDKWNLDFTNPFFQRSHTVYFGYKPYIVVGDSLNISNIITEDSHSYRLVGPKENGSNHAIFIIPKFTDEEFCLFIEYQDITNEPLFVNVFDRERSYIPIGQLENKADGEWKKQRIIVPSGINCPAEGFIFEMTSSDKIEELHPIKYIYVNDDSRNNPIYSIIPKELNVSIDLSEWIETLIESNCYFICDADSNRSEQFKASLQVGATRIDLRSALMNGSYVIEVPSELINLFEKTSVSTTEIPINDLLEVMTEQKEKEISSEQIHSELNALQCEMKNLHEKHDRLLVNLQNVEAELEIHRNIKIENERQIVWFQNRTAELELLNEGFQNDYKDLTEKYENLTIDYEKIARFQSRVAELEIEKHRYVRELEQLNEKYEGILGENRQLLREVDNKIEALQDLSTKLEKLEKMNVVQFFLRKK
ncbi:bifunctional 2-polyprenyl-6-hydroxyphenol methylase/3-demethylubiquinol 3-O-methyltransferase UbiG [Brevibacillus sp. MS2.2]|uniref:class I SAM-dependent methyltransferase n=1 Tax=Brevibacillus sp. MS2.2 TaxID=2738981 RepID=UPI00156B827B|nr:class I SAM-dependent methyltransferase [Brevibacillus sp. MS2.2]NRR19242.1 methyltransferase domain-containing protein [Brevibacillus sp. MS2.2]